MVGVHTNVITPLALIIALVGMGMNWAVIVTLVMVRYHQYTCLYVL